MKFSLVFSVLHKVSVDTDVTQRIEVAIEKMEYIDIKTKKLLRFHEYLLQNQHIKDNFRTGV